MKFRYLIFITFVFIYSCSSDPTKVIEEIYDMDIPECYEEIVDPVKLDPKCIQVVELKLEEECMWEFIDKLGENGVHPSYCGTTGAFAGPLIMVFCKRDNSARMTLNQGTHILHFEMLSE
ncbi:MAG: hypothetical protein GQ574_09640 [Crocinitomix sp.]|nr:hypothetical protein [Crocinitomix sp.]